MENPEVSKAGNLDIIGPPDVKRRQITLPPKRPVRRSIYKKPWDPRPWPTAPETNPDIPTKVPLYPPRSQLRPAA